MNLFRIFLAALVLGSLGPQSSFAQATDNGAGGEAEAEPNPDSGDGHRLIEEGARLFFEGLQREMAPALEGLRERANEIEPALRQFVEEMGPALRELLERAGDLDAYHPPEVLPNGDIILRRKTPIEIDPALRDGEEIEI